MFKIAACDDDPSELTLIKGYVQRYSIRYNNDLTFDGYNSGEELLKDYEKGKYDLMFLDVEMGKMDGIMTADRIRHIPDHDVNIIYVSNYPQYMQASFGVRAAQYLTKPISYEIFENKVNEIIRYIAEDKDKVIEIEAERDKYYIRESEIISIETDGSKLLFITESDFIRARGKLSDYAKKCEKYMVMPNRSTLVNTRFIRMINNSEIVLTNGRRVGISRNRRTVIKQDINRNLRERLG